MRKLTVMAALSPKAKKPKPRRHGHHDHLRHHQGHERSFQTTRWALPTENLMIV